MSRIGNRHLVIPEGVNVTINNDLVIVKGPKGELQITVSPLVKVEVTDNVLTTSVVDASSRANVMQGTTNSLINNMIIGVHEGFSKGLEAVGVGYRFNVQGNKIVVNAGYSHPVEVMVPGDLKAELVSNTELTISGIDKQKVSEFAANIRKGIRYKDEYVRRKEGKKAA